MSVGNDGRGARADLIEREQQRRVETGAGAARGDVPRGFYQVFHERRDQGGGVVRTGPGRQQVERPLITEERFGVEVLTLTRRDGIEHTRVGESGKSEGDALPDGVAGAGVGVDHRLQGVDPSGRSSRVGGEDRYRLGGSGGVVEGPAEQLARRPMIQSGGVEQGLEGGAGLAFPEAAALDPAGR